MTKKQDMPETIWAFNDGFSAQIGEQPTEDDVMPSAQYTRTDTVQAKLAAADVLAQTMRQAMISHVNLYKRAFGEDANPRVDQVYLNMERDLAAYEGVG